jgi:hypothetical protein
MSDKDKCDELHDVFLKVPAGSPDDEKPLVHDLRLMVRAYKRTSWAFRMLSWGIPTIAALGVAAKTIAEWFF